MKRIKKATGAVVRKLTGKKLPTSTAHEWTEYMKCLSLASAGMIEPGNVDCFDYAIKNLPSNAPIVEIGSLCGLSTNMITHCKERHGVRNALITCSQWTFEGAGRGGMLEGSKTVSRSEYHNFVKDTFKRTIRLFSQYDLPYAIEMFSDEFFFSWDIAMKCTDVFDREIRLGGLISFSYIDGKHSYEYVKRDFDNCDRYLEPEGFLLFNNSADGSEWEGGRLMEEIARSGRYDLIARNPNYFFKKKAR